MRSRHGFKLGAVLSGALLVGGCGRSSGSQALPSATPSAEAIAPASAAPVHADPKVAAGARAYAHYCKLCHAKDATGYAADNAPSLVTKTFLESATDELIAAGIRMGRPGTAMAAYGKTRGGPLEESEISAIVAFLRSKGPRPQPLPAAPVSGDAARGQAVFEKSCALCHGPAGKGDGSMAAGLDPKPQDLTDR